MQIGWLQDFLTLAELGNFTRAAEARNASQAAFSRRIMALEAWLGTALVDRSVFPAKLTPGGQAFREAAAEIMHQLADARMALAGNANRSRDEVRLALPHAIATGRLAAWTAEWSSACNTRHAIMTGNVTDTVTALVEGGVDILICFHSPQQPFHLSMDRYERLMLGIETLRPYASPAFIKSINGDWQGTPRRPTQALMYSPGAYLGRMVDLIFEKSSPPFYGQRVADSDMADVLRELAIGGQGVAWLPDCSARQAPPGALQALGNEAFSLPLSVIAYCDRSMKKASARRIWTRLASSEFNASRAGAIVDVV